MAAMSLWTSWSGRKHITHVKHQACGRLERPCLRSAGVLLALRVVPPKLLFSTGVDNQVARVLDAGGLYEANDGFWKCVAQFVCQGRMRDAAELLQLHSQHVAST